MLKTLTVVAAMMLLTTSCAGFSQLTASGTSEPPLSNPGFAGDEDPTLTTTVQPAATAPGSGDGDGSTTTAAPAVQDAAVSQILSGYTTWNDPGLHVPDDRNLQPDQWFDDASPNGREKVPCAPSVLPTVVRELDEFPAFGFSGDDVLPGLIVDGSAATSGNIRALPLARAPFTLRSSLASANPTVVVESPNSGTIAEAVSTLKRDADPRLGSIDVTQSDIKYDSSETHSFEHSSLEVGVSLRYRNRLASAGLDADYSQERSVERHTITVQMVQRQLTLSMVDDAVSSPGQYFDAGVTGAEI
ncbi:MAG: thiol-activated cytolysin family protein, partial [Acidimicrobiia bacterium]|nr:thiol-activated cytolysin family protein [Acidimicrobiia bacterium]